MRRRGPRGLAFVMLAASVLLAAGRASAHDVVQPRPKTQPAATWPAGHVAARDVFVPVIITVAEDGSVSSVDVEASVSPDLDRAAIAAAAKWTFEPALRDGKPLPAKIRSVVRFAGP